MYDLLLKGGRVIDPSREIDESMDVAVKDGKIARMARGIPPSEALDVLDVSGKIVAPGLVDVHTHIYHPGRNWNPRRGRRPAPASPPLPTRAAPAPPTLRTSAITSCPRRRRRSIPS